MDMGSLKFAMNMLLKNIRQCIFYMVSMIFASAVILNTFNLLFNEDFISSSDESYKIFSAIAFIVLLTAMFFVAFANLYFIYGKTKELAIAVLSGRSVYTVGFILTIQNLLLGLIGTFIGFVIGFAVMPLINIYVYSSAGFPINKFAFSNTGFIITILILIIQYVMMIVIDMGYVYRREIIELLNEQSKMYEFKAEEESIVDSSNPQLSYLPPSLRAMYTKEENNTNKDNNKKNIMYLVICFLPLVTIVIPTSIENKLIIANGLAFIALFGVLRILNKSIPEFINKIKSKKYLYDEIKLQSLSNLLYSLKKAKYLVIYLILSVMCLINLISVSKDLKYVRTVIIIAYIVVTCLMAITINFKVFIEALTRRRCFKQLKLIGYTNNKIKKIIREEIQYFYGIILLVPLVNISFILFLNYICGYMTGSTFVVLILIYLGVNLISALISLVGYNKMVFHYLREE